VSRTQVEQILSLRELHRQEMNCQIIADSYPQRGLSDPYLFEADGQVVGYGLVANKYYPNTVNEFYVAPSFRAAALPMFRQLLDVSQASHIRTQTNDRLLLLMLYDCAGKITPDNVLFADALTTSLTCPGGVLRKRTGDNKEDWVIESGGEIVAKGGVLFHYNPPYGDIFMDVEEPQRRRGFGSYLVQELKRICYEMGKIPAARCNADNFVSRKALQKAGMLPCGRVLQGEVLR
jgi:GNAT superfamily N-acetyltransferase